MKNPLRPLESIIGSHAFAAKAAVELETGAEKADDLEHNQKPRTEPLQAPNALLGWRPSLVASRLEAPNALFSSFLFGIPPATATS